MAAPVRLSARRYGDSMSKKSKRKLVARRHRPRVDPRVKRVAAPKTRLKSLFALLHDVITSADRALLGTENADQPLVRFDVAMLQRGINTLKAVRLLTEHGHWEFAASATRQLYELVVNMEYLATEADREEATLLYAKFGLLQAVQAQHREVIYNQSTGRPIDEQRLAVLESMLEHTFPEFRDERRDGSVKGPGTGAEKARASWPRCRRTVCGSPSTSSCSRSGLNKRTPPRGR
jgi:hypothetical protein